MEVSSQALKYGRVAGIAFDVGVFLNISEDHISPVEHKSFKDYFCSKLQLFHQVRTAVVNLDSEFSRTVLMEASSAGRILTFGTKPGADIYGHDVCVENGKVRFSVTCDRFEGEFSLAMHGIFNVENALAAIAVAYACELPFATMQKGLAGVTVDGRMEEYSSRDQKLKAIVDYAHNGLSFEKIFDSVRVEYPDYKIVSVFGCPGGKEMCIRDSISSSLSLSIRYPEGSRLSSLIVSIFSKSSSVRLMMRFPCSFRLFNATFWALLSNPLLDMIKATLRNAIEERYFSVIQTGFCETSSE